MKRAVFKSVAPYARDAMRLPVKDIDSAIPYYEKTLGFRVVSREEVPLRRVILERDYVQIGLVENGGDPSQEGCFISVENLDAAFEEIRGEPPKIPFGSADFRSIPYRAFFEVAPDGLCYMIGEPEK